MPPFLTSESPNIAFAVPITREGDIFATAVLFFMGLNFHRPSVLPFFDETQSSIIPWNGQTVFLFPYSNHHNLLGGCDF
jgi:hypothetical protein